MNDKSKQDHLWNYADGLRKHNHESSDCVEYPKNSLLKSSHPKKYLPNFPTQANEKFQTQKIPLIIPDS